MLDVNIINKCICSQTIEKKTNHEQRTLADTISHNYVVVYVRAYKHAVWQGVGTRFIKDAHAFIPDMVLHIKATFAFNSR